MRKSRLLLFVIAVVLVVGTSQWEWQLKHPWDLPQSLGISCRSDG